MSTQTICYLANAISTSGAIIALYLWISAEIEVARNIRDFYKQPRVNRYPYTASRLRRAALNLIGRKRSL